MTVVHTDPAEPVRPNSVSNTDTGPRAEGELQGALSDEILVGEDDAAEDRHEAQGRHQDAQQENNGDVLHEPGDDEEAEEEAEPKRIAPSPVLPTAAEIEDHRISHFPYRNWCPHCVAGRALGERRGAGALGWQPGRHVIPVIMMDYFYLTSGGLKVKKELSELGYLNDDTISDAR